MAAEITRPAKRDLDDIEFYDGGISHLYPNHNAAACPRVIKADRPRRAFTDTESTRILLRPTWNREGSHHDEHAHGQCRSNHFLIYNPLF